MGKLPTTQPDQSLRVLIIDAPGYTAKRQRDECAAFANGVEINNFEDWVRFARPQDSLVLASLRLLGIIDRRKLKGRPTAILNKRIATAVATRSVVIEASSGARSDDRRTWPSAVESANNFIRSGGKMTKAEAQRRGRAGGKKGGAVIQARSAEQRWKNEPALLTRYRAVWKSREYASDAARLKAINDMLLHEGRGGMVFGSTWTARRVFGNSK